MRYSDSYVMTVYPESAGDMLELETVRKSVRIMNRNSKKKFYIKLAGRYGRNNPRYNSRKANWGCVPLGDAERYDVYIYERYTYEQTGS